MFFTYAEGSAVSEHGQSTAQGLNSVTSSPSANHNIMVLAYYHTNAPIRNSDLGLPARLSHPCNLLLLELWCIYSNILICDTVAPVFCTVRILSCHYIPNELEKQSQRKPPAPDFSPASWKSDWVLELESPFLLYSG